MKLARAALGAVLIALGAPAVAQEPETPFVSLGDIQRARSTYIIQLSEDVPASRLPSRAQALTRQAGGVLRHTYGKALHGFAATMSSVALAKLLKDNDDIVSVQRDTVDRAFAKPNCGVDSTHPSCGGSDTEDPPVQPPSGDPVCVYDSNAGDTGRAWGVDRVDADQARVAGKCGKDVHIYILDSGIDMDHADLGPIGTSVDCTKGGCPAGGDDKNGHGTHVAGTAAARANGQDVIGVAPQAILHSVRVLGGGGVGFRSDIIAGIEWVMTNKEADAVVANMSIGGGRSTPSGTESCEQSGYVGTDTYYRAICNAARAGVIFVVAAGNETQDTANVAPAGYDGAVITVSATASNDSWASFSNYGDEVDIAAPGVSIRSTKKGGGTTTMSGTSMASPHVAGAVAVWLAEKPQVADYSAFTNALTAVTTNAEPRPNVPNHSEDLLDAANMVGVDSADN